MQKLCPTFKNTDTDKHRVILCTWQDKLKPTELNKITNNECCTGVSWPVLLLGKKTAIKVTKCLETISRCISSSKYYHTKMSVFVLNNTLRLRKMPLFLAFYLSIQHAIKISYYMHAKMTKLIWPNECPQFLLIYCFCVKSTTFVNHSRSRRQQS